MAHHTAEFTNPTDLPENISDAPFGRLYLDLGLGETASVDTVDTEWDWFRRPEALSAEAAHIALAALRNHSAVVPTDVPEVRKPMQAAPEPRTSPQQGKKHAPGENSVTPYQLMDSLGYDRPMLTTILNAIRPLEVQPGRQVTSITRDRVNGFVRGMMESAHFLNEKVNRPPITALEKDRLFGPENMHAPQSDESVASYYTLARSRALNSRYRNPAFKAKADAASKDVGWAHEIADIKAETAARESRFERMANNVKTAVKSKLRSAVDRIKLSVATRIEQRYIKADAAQLQKTFSKLPPLAFFDRDPQVDTMPDWQPPADVVANQKVARVDYGETEFQKGSTFVNQRAKRPVFEPTAGLTIIPGAAVQEGWLHDDALLQTSTHPVRIPGQRSAKVV